MNAPDQPLPALARLIDRIGHARAHGQRLAVRGGGSKDFYGEPARGEHLCTREIGGIVSHEPSELVITARAGTPLAEVEAALARHGQCLPFDPPRFAGRPAAQRAQDGVQDQQDDQDDQDARATLGGMVAAGLSGPARASVGAVRDFVLGAELVNGRAEVLRFGGQVMKNVAGYDVSRLLAGSLGALGVITEVSLKVLPQPPARATLAFGMAQAEALAALAQWGGQPLPLHASAWIGGRLLVRLAGARAAVDAAVAQLGRRHGGTRLEAGAAQALWRDLREQRLAAVRPAPGLALWRLSVPQTAPAVAWHGAHGEPVVEWHGAQRWVLAPLAAAEGLRGQARGLGGHATVFRAPAPGPDAAHGGGAAAVAVFQPLPAALARIQARVQAAFDPDGVFGGGRLARARDQQDGQGVPDVQGAQDAQDAGGA